MCRRRTARWVPVLVVVAAVEAPLMLIFTEEGSSSLI